MLAAERYSVSVEYGNFTTQEIASIGTNLLSGGTFQPKLNLSGCSDTYSPERGEGVKVEIVTPRLWDDKPDTYNSLSASKYKWKVNNGVMYIDIWFDLQKLYKIDKLFINHYNGTIACLKTGEYEIYASKDLESLFESESRIIKYDNTASSKNGSTVSQLIGSIFARSRNLLWEPAKRVIEKEALSLSANCCRVVPAELGEHIGDYATVAAALL